MNTAFSSGWRLVGLACLVVGLGMLAACGGTCAPSATPSPSTPPLPIALIATPEPIKQVALSWTGVPPGATVVVQEDPDGQSGFVDRLEVPPGASSARLEVSLALRTGARYRLRVCLAGQCQESDAVGLSADLSVAVGYFKPSDDGLSSMFGGITALSADGRTMAVGALQRGGVEVFVREEGGWRSQVVFNEPIEGVQWATHALSISADGSVLAIARSALPQSREVLIMTRRDGVWSLSDRLFQYACEEASFGASLGLSAAGDVLAVGAPNCANDSTGSAVYVYAFGGGTWHQTQHLLSESYEHRFAFGRSVVLSPDGLNLLVGTADLVGWAAPVYRYANGGQGFELADSLSVPGLAEGQLLGAQLVWAGHGEAATIAAGAPCVVNQGSAGSTCVGTVYLWRRNAQEVWTLQAPLRNPRSGTQDGFGLSLALSADGSLLAVGAPFDRREGEEGGGAHVPYASVVEQGGSVFLFRRQGDGWHEPLQLKAPNARAGDGFGSWLSLSADGTTLVVGAPTESSAATGIGGNQANTSAPRRGAAYLY